MGQDVTIKIGADGTQAFSTFHSIEKSVKTMSSSVSGSLSRLGSAWGGVKAVWSDVSSFVAYPVQMAAALDDSTVKFKHMLGSAQAAKSLMGELRDISNDTGLNIAVMADGVERMLRAGYSLRESMQVLKDSAILSRGDSDVMSTMIQRLAIAKSSGRGVTDEVISPFKDYGINVAGTMRDNMGLSQKKFQERLGQGIDVSQMMLALNELAGSAQQEFDELNGGTTSTLQAVSVAWENAVAGFGQGIMGSLLPSLKDLQSGLVDIQPAAETLGQTVGIQFKKIWAEFQNVTGGFEGIASSMSNASKRFEEFMDVAGPFVTIMGALATTISYVLKFIIALQETWGVIIGVVANTIKQLATSPLDYITHFKTHAEYARRQMGESLAEIWGVKKGGVKGYGGQPGITSQLIPQESKMSTSPRERAEIDLQSTVDAATRVNSEDALRDMNRSFATLAVTWKDDVEMSQKIADAHAAALPVAKQSLESSKRRLAAEEAQRKAEEEAKKATERAAENKKRYLEEKEKYERGVSWQFYDELPSLRQKKRDLERRAGELGVAPGSENITNAMNRMGTEDHDDKTRQKLEGYRMLRDEYVKLEAAERKATVERATRDAAQKQKMELLKAQAVGDEERAEKLRQEAALIERINTKLSEGLTLREAKKEASQEISLEYQGSLMEAKRNHRSTWFEQTDYSAGRGTAGIKMPDYSAALVEAKSQTRVLGQIEDLVRNLVYNRQANAVMAQ